MNKEKRLIASELIKIAKELTGSTFQKGESVRLTADCSLAVYGKGGQKIPKGAVGIVQDVDDVSHIEVKFEVCKYAVPVYYRNLEKV